jgi:hypothetical protein
MTPQRKAPASVVAVAKLIGVAGLFAAGLLLAGGLAASGAADVTTTETVPVTTTVFETTTAPATTAVTTVEHTTTRKVNVTTTGTTTGSGSTSTTPTWVWVVLAILAAAVIGLLIALLSRRGVSTEERQRRLDAAVANWAAQGWALENQTGDSAILRRGSELMVVSIDDKGQINARPLASREGWS